jgi:hypothetical protein
MLKIGNIYGHGFNDQQIEKLGLMGFSIRPQVSRFAGSQVLRFIDFPEWPSLEFIEVEDEKDYLEFLPKGMVPYCPGINLVLSTNAPTGLIDFQGKFKDWGPYSIHVNYDGSDDAGKPGWNYLNFEIPVARDTFIWLTEQEEPKPSVNLVTIHPNKVNCVTGLVFDMEEDEILEFSQLVDTKIVDGVFKVNGVKIISRNAFDCSKRISDKEFPLVAIVVRSESLNNLQVEGEGVEEIQFFSKPSLYIPTNELSWDLIITT